MDDKKSIIIVSPNAKNKHYGLHITSIWQNHTVICKSKRMFCIQSCNCPWVSVKK